MAYLRLNNIYKVYPSGVKAVNDFSLGIEEKEFIVIVGPSGCGKSTLLRMIAGLEDITAGELLLDGKLINDVEAQDRDMAMVFQNYALYPHMNVYDNLAFGLRNRKIKEKDISVKIKNAVKILGLEDQLHKKPKEMSGGQAQRVALGRAIVRDPKVFLFDEPLSNLDAKLRSAMRNEITNLHKRLKTTFIYVTHDQVEAMTMGTRIVVMKDGYMQQTDTPMNLYYKPVNKFVAGFIGTPQMNFFPVTLKRNNDVVVINFEGQSSYQIPFVKVGKINSVFFENNRDVILGVRPEHFEITQEETGLSIIVTSFEQLGNEGIIYGQFESSVDEFVISEETNTIIIKAKEDTFYQNGQKINLKIKEDKFHLFDKETENTILKEIPDYSSVEGFVNGSSLTLFNQKIKLVEVWAKQLKALDKVTVEIPPHAFIKGDEFKLPVSDVEVFNNQYLLHLAYENKFIFAFSNEKITKGEIFSFALAYDQIHVYNLKEEIITPIATEDSLTGTLIRKKIAGDSKFKQLFKPKYDYCFVIEQHEFPITNEVAKKLMAIDGRKAFKTKYRFAFNRSDLHISDTQGIPASTLETIDYGKTIYAKVGVGEQELLLKLNQHENIPTDFLLDLNIEKAEVWHPVVNFRII